MRGLNAPPRRAVAPAALTAWAVARICSSLSTEQGPAMTPIVPPPTRQAAGADDRRLGLHFAAGDFVRGEDRHDFGHAGAAFQRFLVRLAIVADHGDHGPFGAHDDVGFRPSPSMRWTMCSTSVWLGLFFHDDDHGVVPD